MLQGVDSKKIMSLKAGFGSSVATEPVNFASPSQEQLISLLGHYQNGQFSDAEKLALLLSVQFPSHNFSWKILAAVYKITGRLSEAVSAGEKTVEISPDDAEAYFNLANTLKELGRLDEASNYLGRAIAVKPDYFEAYNNLGSWLLQANKFDEAEASLLSAISLKPNFAPALTNLGAALYGQGRLSEAEIRYRQSVHIEPGYSQTYCNLGLTLYDQGKLKEAEKIFRKSFEKDPDCYDSHRYLARTLFKLGRLAESEKFLRAAIAIRPDDAAAQYQLGFFLKKIGRLDEARASFMQAEILQPDYGDAILMLAHTLAHMNLLDKEMIVLETLSKIDTDEYRLRAGVKLAICKFLVGDFSECKKGLLASNEINEKHDKKFLSEKVYRRFLLSILSWHEENEFYYYDREFQSILYVIGESHCLVSHELCVKNRGSTVLCRAKLIRGCKQWHLGNPVSNQYKYHFESIFSSLPISSEVMLAIGEIDCRIDSGIIEHKTKFPEKDITTIIVATVENYLSYVLKCNNKYQHKIIIQGVPCPNISIDKYHDDSIAELIEVILIFNTELEARSQEKGFKFLDVHKLTDRGDGFSNAAWHIDHCHLSPDGMLEAWKRHSFKELKE